MANAVEFQRSTRHWKWGNLGELYPQRLFPCRAGVGCGGRVGRRGGEGDAGEPAVWHSG